ncbi:disease resistance protein RML1B-like [Bidens hawaiensis]|uniref:disease resistance protein RML1B-like n=1 Tax=Bidens hawaiensis TaxID=980011 RepID=UPI0040499890
MVVLTELLPISASSSSTHDHGYRYDVFLSFRGVDTRNSFTDHLYNALMDIGLTTFLDEEEIETGQKLKPELESAIKSSYSSIIVLSKNYASSTWCLDELVLILEQRRNFNQIFIPIFYYIEPTDVRKLQGSFGDAMEKHVQKMDAEINDEKKRQWAEKMEVWKTSLGEVVDLKGKGAKGRKETELIEEIVTELHRRLGVALVSTTPPLLIGMKHDIKFITSWLTDGSCYVADVLTIVGMGGIGKTSLAKHVFQLHSRKFAKSSFIEGISRNHSERFSGLFEFKKQLAEDISEKRRSKVNDISVYTSKIENALAHKKVLLVLDDVNCLEQLDALLGDKAFHLGSKIIITTKDSSLTESCALFNPQVQPKHTMILLKGLSEVSSLELLCHHAFKCKDHIKEGYEDVSKNLVKYCEGYPLALEVLGRSLYKRDVAYWKECIQGLKKETDSRINKVLKMSFDSLQNENDKELFKHLACFFVGKDKDLTETILNACGMSVSSGLTNLIERCLLNIQSNNELTLHSLIQEMGRDLICRESPKKPWKHSRLWSNEESHKVLKQNKGTDKTIGLTLDTRMLEKDKLRGSFELKIDALSKMENLLLLQLNYVQMTGSNDNFPEELRWLCMHGFSLKSIPADLPMENLVVLDMSYSNIESFGVFNSNPQLVSIPKLVGSYSQDKRLLRSSKILDLSFCEQLASVTGFFHVPVLERLIVRKCISLLDICESIEECGKLIFMDTSYCHNLKKLPRSLGKLKNVETLVVDGCNFVESRIEVMEMGINSQASSSALVVAIPRELKSVAISLPCSLLRLSLKGTKLSTESFPTDFSTLSMLKDLYLDGIPIVSMPSCLRTLPRLETLSMFDCKRLKTIECPPRTLRVLSHNSYSNASQRYQPSLQKVVFDPEMSQLQLLVDLGFSASSSIEIQGIVKIQPLADVDENVLRSLDWSDMEFIRESCIKSYNSQTQMYYEFGIFSTFYEGKGLPDWIRRRFIGTSISFTIPSSSKKLRGLNFGYMQTLQSPDGTFRLPDKSFFVLPVIKVINKTKNHTWIYKHCIEIVSVFGARLIFLSHWMFGANEMEVGDEITIIVTEDRGQTTRQCGIGFVYDEGSIKREDDALGYYKSWNHIIGGDISAFQLTTGEYVLYFRHFVLGMNTIPSHVYLSNLLSDSPTYYKGTCHFFC